MLFFILVAMLWNHISWNLLSIYLKSEDILSFCWQAYVVTTHLSKKSVWLESKFHQNSELVFEVEVNK